MAGSTRVAFPAIVEYCLKRLGPEEMAMKVRFAAFLLSFAVVCGAAFAHGDLKHVSGTVEKITAGSIFVKTADGKSVEVKLVSSTVYIFHAANQSGTSSDASLDKPAKFADLAVGDRVLIHAKPNGDTLEAAEVKFSAAAAVATKPKS
jgi:hypothetical protein